MAGAFLPKKKPLHINDNGFVWCVYLAAILSGGSVQKSNVTWNTKNLATVEGAIYIFQSTSFFGIYLTNKQQDQEGPFLNHPGANSIVNFHHLPDAAAIQTKHPGSRLKSHQWVLVTWEECVCANRHPFIYIVTWLVSCYSQIPWSECFWKMRMS